MQFARRMYATVRPQTDKFFKVTDSKVKVTRYILFQKCTFLAKSYHRDHLPVVSLMYLACLTILERAIAKGRSVLLSDRPSVCLAICTIKLLFSSFLRPNFVVNSNPIRHYIHVP